MPRDDPNPAAQLFALLAEEETQFAQYCAFVEQERTRCREERTRKREVLAAACLQRRQSLREKLNACDAALDAQVLQVREAGAFVADPSGLSTFVDDLLDIHERLDALEPCQFDYGNTDVNSSKGELSAEASTPSATSTTSTSTPLTSYVAADDVKRADALDIARLPSPEELKLISTEQASERITERSDVESMRQAAERCEERLLALVDDGAVRVMEYDVDVAHGDDDGDDSDSVRRTSSQRKGVQCVRRSLPRYVAYLSVLCALREESLDHQASLFARRLSKVVLEPLIREGLWKVVTTDKKWQLRPSETASTSSSSTPSSSSSDAPLVDTAAASPCDFAMLADTVESLFTFLAAGDHAACSRFATVVRQHMWPLFCDKLIQWRIAASVPQEAGDLASFQATAKDVVQLERRLAPTQNKSNAATGAFDKVTSSGDRVVMLLSTYLAGVDRLYAVKRRAALLQKARDLILKRVADSSQEKLHGLLVTHTADALVNLAFHVLAEVSVTMSAECARLLKDAVADMFAIFVALQNEYVGETLFQVPRKAALLHNDCVYLAEMLPVIAVRMNQSTTLASRHADKEVDAKVSRNSERRRRGGGDDDDGGGGGGGGEVTDGIVGAEKSRSIPCMLDPAAVQLLALEPSFARLRQQCFASILRSQEQEIEVSLQSVHSLANAHEGKNAEAIERMGKRLAHQMKQLDAATRDVLGSPLRINMAAQLIGAASKALVQMLLQLEDIGDEESHALQKALQPHVSYGATVMKDFFKLGSDEAAVVKCCWPHRDWQVLCQCVELLTMSLADIKQCLDTGVYDTMDAPVLQHFVKALFADSEKRTALLTDVERFQLNK